jgi:hypothetical protein
MVVALNITEADNLLSFFMQEGKKQITDDTSDEVR